MQNIDEITKKNSQNTHPFVACIGTPSSISSAVVIFNKKVITDTIGSLVVSSLLVSQGEN